MTIALLVACTAVACDEGPGSGGNAPNLAIAVAAQDEFSLPADSGAPRPRVVHAAVALGPDSVLLVVEPAPFLRLYAVDGKELRLVAAAGEPGAGPGQIERPWRAVAIGDRVWLYDFGGSGTISVWRTAPLEELERFQSLPRTVDILAACGGMPAAIYQARPAATRPAYGLAVRENARWRTVSPLPPDTIPLVLSWEDSRGVSSGDEVLFFGVDGGLFHLSCDGGTPRREPLTDRSSAPAAHGAGFDGEMFLQFYAPRHDRAATVAYERRRGESAAIWRSLSEDVRLHGYQSGFFWLIRHRDKRPVAVVRMDSQTMRRWLERFPGERESLE